jgi:copper(I)-binding protein
VPAITADAPRTQKIALATPKSSLWEMALWLNLREIYMGVAKMRPVEGGLEIKPGETVEFKPGSFHVMLMALKQPLQKGEKVKGTLEFEKAGKVDIEYAVEALGATAPTAGEHQH